MLHLCVAFYSNDTFVTNTVCDENLKENIKYNRTMRPGRFYFVDGKYVCGGLLREPYQSAFIAKCEQRIQDMELEPANYDTAPYN